MTCIENLCGLRVLYHRLWHEPKSLHFRIWNQHFPFIKQVCVRYWSLEHCWFLQSTFEIRQKWPLKLNLFFWLKSHNIVYGEYIFLCKAKLKEEHNKQSAAKCCPLVLVQITVWASVGAFPPLQNNSKTLSGVNCNSSTGVRDQFLCPWCFFNLLSD